MILQFPTPYPDELLYSVIARYHIRTGNIFWKHTLEDLFGKRSVSATAFLPSSIQAIIRRLPKNTTLNEQIIVQNNTMFPLYTAFLLEEKAQSIYRAMLSQDGQKIYMQSGVMASSIKQNKWFKYCPNCFLEDFEQYSELYWHRMHQLPGRLVCLKHGLWLEDSTVPIVHSYNHSFIAPTKNNCDLTKENRVEENILNQFESFIKSMELLLNSTYPRKSYSHFTNFYYYHLFRNGIASINGKVYRKKLNDDFLNYYSHDFLECLNIKTTPIDSWLVYITRKHRKSFHPYYHFLLLNFLGLSIDAVFKETVSNNNPFGEPNWLCVNIICPHYKKEVIQDISIRRCESTRKPIGRFTCPRCGFSYTRKGISQNKEVEYKDVCVMDYGVLWREELQRLIEDGRSYSEIAKVLNANPATVSKHAKVLKDTAVIIKQRPNGNKNNQIERHRKEWLDVQNKHPNLSKNALRQLKPASYSFLYRCDTQWLHNNSPLSQKRKVKNKRVNWEERDLEILQGIKKATEDLKRMNDCFRRITIKSLGNCIGQEDLLVKHLNKMPKTKEYIERVLETERDFRMRKVNWAVKKLLDSGEAIVSWRVLKKAGISFKFADELKDYIESYQKMIR